MMAITDWLEELLAEQQLRHLPCDGDPSEFGMLAGVLRAQAYVQGYRVAELEDACDGDITMHLMHKFSARNSSDVETALNI